MNRENTLLNNDSKLYNNYNASFADMDDKDSLYAILDFINVLIKKLKNKKIDNESHLLLHESIHRFYSLLMGQYHDEEANDDLREIVVENPEMHQEMVELFEEHDSLINECGAIVKICDNMKIDNPSNIKMFEKKFKLFKKHLAKHDKRETNYLLDSMYNETGAVD